MLWLRCLLAYWLYPAHKKVIRAFKPAFHNFMWVFSLSFFPLVDLFLGERVWNIFGNKNLIIKEICLHINSEIVNVNSLVKSPLAFRCCSPTLSARMLISRTTSCWLSFKKVSTTHSYNWYQPFSFYCIARQSACTCCRISFTTLQTISQSLTLAWALHTVPITIRLITPVNAMH